MKIGDNIIVTKKSKVLNSVITYVDNEKSCGYVELSPEVKFEGTIIDYKIGWFFNYWIIALTDGTIKKIRCDDRF